MCAEYLKHEKKKKFIVLLCSGKYARTHTHTVNAFVISIIKYNRIELYIIIYGDDGENCIVFPFPFRSTSECYSERRRNTKRTYPEDKGNNLCVYLMEIEKDFYLFIYVRFCFCVVLCSTSCMLLTLPFLFVVPCLQLSARDWLHATPLTKEMIRPVFYFTSFVKV